MNDLTIDLINKKFELLDYNYDDKYLQVYPKLIEFANRQDVLDDTSVTALAHMVYGWMPTIIKFDTLESFDNTLTSKIKDGALDEEFLFKLKTMVNNSIVGVSKLLHFINPEAYAIWDSRVFQSITGYKPHAYRVNKVSNFIEYTEKMRALTQLSEVDELKKNMISKGYCNSDTSKMRVLEAILFYTYK